MHLKILTSIHWSDDVRKCQGKYVRTGIFHDIVQNAFDTYLPTYIVHWSKNPFRLKLSAICFFFQMNESRAYRKVYLPCLQK